MRKKLLLVLFLLLCTPIFSSSVQAMPNPSSVFCKEQGYYSEIRTHPNGGQYGVCIFPDGEECEEWDFYNGVCGGKHKKKPYKAIFIIAGAFLLIGFARIGLMRFSKRVIKQLHRR